MKNKKILTISALCAAFSLVGCRGKKDVYALDKIIYVAGTNADTVERVLAELREDNTKTDETSRKNAALITAVKKDDTAELKRLIKAGADVNAAGDRGQTALIMAAFGNRADITKVLLEAGANVNAARKDGDTALMYAAERDAEDVAELLIAAGADVSTKNEDGKTALMLAKEHDAQDVIELLKAAGAKE